ncbi:MAG: FixH family protein [Chloroflexota bacterium]
MLSVLLLPQSVFAHTRAEVGPYVVIVGWESEPVIVGERNALIFDIHDADQEPVTGVDATLDIEVLYGGQTFRSNITATEKPGYYTAEIFPTVRGQYSVHLFGTIEDEDVDVVVDPEEVLSAARLQFPEVAPDTRDLRDEIVVLQEELSSVRTLARVGIGFGIFGIAFALFALFRGRVQKKQ